MPTAEDADAIKDKITDAAEVGKEVFKETNWSAVFDTWQFKLAAALALSLVALWAWRKVRRTIRRRRGPKIHPRLRKYSGEPDPAQQKLAAARREQAAYIVATSSSVAIAGYELLEQVEAVYVDGFRRPEEALEGLKASAAMKGGNAVVNVRHERNASGECSAYGDAVVVQRIGQEMEKPPFVPPQAGGERAPGLDDEQSPADDDVRQA